jgi:hypothetical protein
LKKGLKKILLINIHLPINKGKININKIDNANPITPNNLLGIDLNIAYNGEKYHSGTICGGVTKGFPNI